MQRLLNIKPRGGGRVIVGLLPILLASLLYLGASAVGRIDGSQASMTPTVGAMAQSMVDLARPDPQTGHSPLLSDTVVSIGRIGAGLTIAVAIALLMGLSLGLLPFKRAACSPLLRVLSAVPPIALLPILCVAFGLGEATKIALIVLGVTPFMIRDLAAHIAAIPEEQIVKAQTLGASTWQTAVRIALPVALPKLVGTLRASLGPAWVLLIAAEALAADGGLGYRIFEAGRSMRMEVIIPYVAWISLLAVAADFALARGSRHAFAWAHPVKPR